MEICNIKLKLIMFLAFNGRAMTMILFENVLLILTCFNFYFPALPFLWRMKIIKFKEGNL